MFVTRYNFNTETYYPTAVAWGSQSKLSSINNTVLNDLSVTFIPTEVLKHSTKSKPLDKCEYRAYEDKNLCVIACLKEYISRRNKHERLTTDQLIITLRKQFKGASINTFGRWIKDIFIAIHIVSFSPHSCQAVSSSKAKREEAVGKSEKTFLNTVAKK